MTVHCNHIHTGGVNTTINSSSDITFVCIHVWLQGHNTLLQEYNVPLWGCKVTTISLIQPINKTSPPLPTVCPTQYGSVQCFIQRVGCPGTKNLTFPSSSFTDFVTYLLTSDMQGLVWGEPELTHKHDIVLNGSLKYATWRNETFLDFIGWHSC